MKKLVYVIARVSKRKLNNNQLHVESNIKEIWKFPVSTTTENCTKDHRRSSFIEDNMRSAFCQNIRQIDSSIVSTMPYS